MFVNHDATGARLNDSEFASSLWPVKFKGAQQVSGDLQIPDWLQRDPAITKMGFKPIYLRWYEPQQTPTISLNCGGKLIGFLYNKGGFIDNNQFLPMRILNYARIVQWLRDQSVRSCDVANDVSNGKRIVSFEIHGDMCSDASLPPIIKSVANSLKMPLTCLLVSSFLTPSSLSAWQNASDSPYVLIGSHSMTHPYVWSQLTTDAEVLDQTKGSIDALLPNFPNVVNYLDFSGDMNPTADQLRLINAAGVNHGAKGASYFSVKDDSGNLIYEYIMPLSDSWFWTSAWNPDIPLQPSFTAFGDYGCSDRGLKFTPEIKKTLAFNRKVGLYTYTFLHDYGFTSRTPQPNMPSGDDTIEGLRYLAAQDDVMFMPTPTLVDRLLLFNKADLTIDKSDEDHWKVTFTRPVGTLNTVKFSCIAGSLPEVTGSSVVKATQLDDRLYVELQSEAVSSFDVNWAASPSQNGTFDIVCPTLPIGMPLSISFTSTDDLGNQTTSIMSIKNGCQVAGPLSNQSYSSIAISAPNCLGRKIKNVTFTPNSVIEVYLNSGDMNNDGKINLFDYVELDRQFACQIDPALDPDGDGYVTLFDYIVLDSEFGASSDN